MKTFLKTALLIAALGSSSHLQAIEDAPAQKKRDPKKLEKAAKAGDAAAMNDLAVLLLKGEEDKDRAIEMLKKAATKGSVMAQANLGRRFELGLDVDQNSESALKYYRMAVKQDDVYSLSYLATMIWRGDGVPRDRQEGCRMLIEAAKKGSARSQFYLGTYYGAGAGVEQDDKKAVEYYKMGALNGDSRAMSSLVRRYISGKGVEKNPKKAVEWLIKGAKEGDPLAQDSLAYSYFYGYGTRKNQKAGVEIWKTIVKDHKRSFPCLPLAEAALKGQGMDQSKQEAARWLSLALKMKNKKAQGPHDKLKDSLSEDELLAAKKWADEFKFNTPKPYDPFTGDRFSDAKAK